MPVTNYTSLLGLALPTTGDLSGTWGDTVNNSITSLVDSAVAGTTTLSTDADVTLTTTNGVANQARQLVLLCSGARTALRTITAPAASKAYVIVNATTGGFGVKIVGAGPTTGVTVAAGRQALVAWNGSDFVLVASTDVNSIASAGTGISISSAGVITNTGVTSLVAGTGVSVSGATGAVTVTNSKPVLGTAVTTSGASSYDLSTSLPSWVRKITVSFEDVGVSSSSAAINLQIGAGSYTTTGYQSSGTLVSTGFTLSSTTGFRVANSGSSTLSYYGTATICLLTGNRWVYSSFLNNDSTSSSAFLGAGSVDIGGTLDRIRIICTAGTFDEGTVNILYE